MQLVPRTAKHKHSPDHSFSLCPGGQIEPFTTGQKVFSAIGCLSEVLLLSAEDTSQIFSPYKWLCFPSSSLCIVLWYSSCCVFLHLVQFQILRSALCLISTSCVAKYLHDNVLIWNVKTALALVKAVSLCMTFYAAYILVTLHSYAFNTPCPNSWCLSSTLVALIISTFHFVKSCHNHCLFLACHGWMIYMCVCVCV